jgi:hypothetical protein
MPVWNPFGRAERQGRRRDVAFTPNVWEVEGLILLKIVSGERTEFAWLPLTELNAAYFRGDTERAVLPVRTSLPPSAEPTRLVRRKIPHAIRKQNRRPVAKATSTVAVRRGAEFVIDGRKSRDPEGQRLTYRWMVAKGDAHPRHGEGAVFRAKAQNRPGELEVRFWVIDGLRASEAKKIRVEVK